MSLEHYYEASSLNYNYAKNNLGILFKYLNDLEKAKMYLNALKRRSFSNV